MPADPRRSGGTDSAALILALIAVLLVVAAFGAFPVRAQTPAQPQTATPAREAATISPVEAQRALAILQDPAKRGQLIETLQTIAKAAPTNTAPAPAAPAAASEKREAVALAPNSLGAQLLVQSSGWVDRVAAAAGAAVKSATDFPLLWRWFGWVVSEPAEMARLSDATWRLVLVLACGLALEWLASLALWRAFASLEAHAPKPGPNGEALPGEDGDIEGAHSPDPSDVGPAPITERLAEHRLSARAARLLRRLPFALARLVLELIPVTIFAVAGNVLAGIVAPATSVRLVILEPVNAYAMCRAVVCVGRMLAAPGTPRLRLLPVGEDGAAYMIRWLRVVAIIAIFGAALADVALLLGLDEGAHDTLGRLLALIVAVISALIVVDVRHAVARHIRAREVDAAFARWRHWLAGIWHYLAILAIAFGWVAWSVGVRDGGFGLRLVFGTAAVLVGARLLTIALLGSLDRALRLAPRYDDQIARYQRPARIFVLFVITAMTVVVLLQLWGAEAFAWFGGSSIGARLVSALWSIAIAAVAAIAVWEMANGALDRRLTRLSDDGLTARSARLRTLLPILRAALLTLILIIVGLTVLSEIGVNIAPLLAGAGIAGVAIGFGSQKLVQDVITGLFVLLENAIQVGDSVTVAGLSGTVEQLSVRNLWLRAADGSVHVVPFSAVSTITNANRGVGNAIVSVTVAFREDIDRVVATLAEIATSMQADPDYARLMLGDLKSWVDSVKMKGVTITGQIACTDSGRWAVQREFNRRMQERFLALGIELGEVV